MTGPGGSDAERRAEKAEAASAALVVQCLVKAARAFTLYLPNNPLHGKFFEDFRRRLGEHLEEHGPLQLELAHDSISYRGEQVYANPELRENLAFRMHADGIRLLAIGEAVEPAELRTLVEILGKRSGEEDEDDIVTRLWSADLTHVTYVLAEAPPPGGAAGIEVAGTRVAQEGALRRYAAELSAAPPAPLLPPPAQQVFSLSAEDLASLQALVAHDEERSPLEDMGAIVEAVLAAEEDPAVLEDLLGILARLCGDLILTGRVAESVTLLSVLARVETSPGLPPERAAAFARTRSGVMGAEVADGLARMLNRGDDVDRGALWALVAALGPAAVEPFCRTLGEVSGKETRKVLIEALAETGRGSPALFLPFLRDPRWYLVRNTIYILRRIGGPEAAQAIGRCAGHADQRVRREALLYFDETGDPAAESVLLGFLGDEAPALRVAAARGLARRGSRAAAEHLLALAAAPGFAACDAAEREAVWEAIGALAPAPALPLLREMLLKRSWFAKARDLEETACAVAGLRRIGGAEALELLRQAAAIKRGEALELVQKALRAAAVGGAPGRPPEGDGEGGGG